MTQRESVHLVIIEDLPVALPTSHRLYPQLIDTVCEYLVGHRYALSHTDLRSCVRMWNNYHGSPISGAEIESYITEAYYDEVNTEIRHDRRVNRVAKRKASTAGYFEGIE